MPSWTRDIRSANTLANELRSSSQYKGRKDRHTILPNSLSEALVHHLEGVRSLHDADRAACLGAVYLSLRAGAKVSEGIARMAVAIRLSSESNQPRSQERRAQAASHG